jgi:hypothetical protein
VTRRIAIGAAVVAIAAVLVVVGVGGSSTETVPSSTITDAAAATSSTRGFRMALNGSMTVPGVNRAIPLQGTGVMDSRRRTAALTMRFGRLPNLPGGMKIDEVLDHFVIYMRSPLFQKGLPGGKSWMKVDLRKTTQQLGLDPSQFSTDPTKALDQLRAVSGNVERVGHESVRGVATTHYRAKVDLRRYATLAPPARRDAARRGVERLIKLTGTSGFPEDVWVDSHKHIRRFAMQFRMKLPNLPGESKTSMKLQEELYDFGARVHVEVPPADQTFDGTKLAQQAQAQAQAQGVPSGP